MRPQDNQNDFFEVYDYKNDSILRSFYASNFPKELLEHHGRDQAFQKILQSAMIARRWSLHTDSSI